MKGLPEAWSRETIHRRPRPVTETERILLSVFIETGVRSDEIKGFTRDRRTTAARWLAFYRMAWATRFSLVQIGRFLGGYDHSSVGNGIVRHCERTGAAPPRGIALNTYRHGRQ